MSLFFMHETDDRRRLQEWENNSWRNREEVVIEEMMSSITVHSDFNKDAVQWIQIIVRKSWTRFEKNRTWSSVKETWLSVETFEWSSLKWKKWVVKRHGSQESQKKTRSCSQMASPTKSSSHHRTTKEFSMQSESIDSQWAFQNLCSLIVL